MKKRTAFIIHLLLCFFIIHNLNMAYLAGLHGQWFLMTNNLVFAGCNAVWLFITYKLWKLHDLVKKVLTGVLALLEQIHNMLVMCNKSFESNENQTNDRSRE